MIFSKRTALTERAVEWCVGQGISITQPFNIVAALDALGELKGLDEPAAPSVNVGPDHDPVPLHDVRVGDEYKHATSAFWCTVTGDFTFCAGTDLVFRRPKPETIEAAQYRPFQSQEEAMSHLPEGAMVFNSRKQEFEIVRGHDVAHVKVGHVWFGFGPLRNIFRIAVKDKPSEPFKVGEPCGVKL